MIEEVSYAVLNGNYALQAGLSVIDDSLASEEPDSPSTQEYLNVIAVKNGNENEEKIVALVNALKSEEIQTWIDETYQGAVISYKGE